MQLSHTIYVHGAISSIHIFTLPCMNLVVIEVRNFILVLYVIEKMKPALYPIYSVFLMTLKIM
jgi:hypothetical protein